MAKTIGQLTQATTLASGDEFVIEQSGLTKRVAASVVRGGLVNADVDAAAAIAFSKLAALDSANILVGNGSNVATKVAVTGDVTISNAGVVSLARPLTLATAQNTTSGTSIDFTGIPSWAKRITVMLDGVSTNGSSEVLIQIGDSGGIETTGYAGGLTFISGANACGALASTSGCIIGGASAGNTRVGCMSISKVSGNKYVFSGMNFNTDQNAAAYSTSIKTLSDVLDRVRITTVNGTDTFDAGSVNIMYEG
jgi:hypothetical protein